jgi:Rrf2 family nitric oxide-sensitive transcriptional repressor
MFKIHKKVKYALIALKHMSKDPDQLITAKEICTQFDIPFDPTARVLQLMAQNGVLKAEQGAHGGYRLVGDLDKLTIYSLSQMVVGGLAVTDCSSEEGACERGHACVLKGAMTKLNSTIVRALKGVPVREMI